MKFLLLSMIVILGINTQTQAQKSNRKSPTETITHNNGEMSVAVTYSRPFKKDRLIFGEKSEGALVPYGKKWRTGANEATIITFNEPMNIDGNPIQAGSYSIYTIPNVEEWTVVFNSRTGYWGKSLFGSPFKEKIDILRIKVKPEVLNSVVEQFSIFIEVKDESHSELKLTWDKTLILINIGY